MRTLAFILAAGLCAVLVYFLSVMIPVSGVLTRLDNRLVDACERVDVFPGTEDVAIDPETGMVFVSAADRRAALAGAPVQGGIFAFPLNDTASVVKVSPDTFGDFQPHGISLWRSAEGAQKLFAINHPIAGGDTVEIFDVAPDGSLTHVRTVAFEQMHSPNDVVAVGPEQFYATNDKGFEGGIMEQVEAYLALPFSEVVYFDGAQGSVAAPGLVYANGVNTSLDGSTLYVAEFLKRRVKAYARDADSGALTHQRTYRLGTNPDNIDVASDGALWIGAHPRVFEFLKHVEDPAAVAPSQVVRLDPSTGEFADMFIDTKGKLNGSSVGAMALGSLVVGSVFDGHVLVCPVASSALAPDMLATQ